MLKRSVLAFTVACLLLLGVRFADCADPGYWRADLRQADCLKLEEVLKEKGCDLRIQGGYAIASSAQEVQSSTCRIICKGRDLKGNMYVILVNYVNDRVERVEVQKVGREVGT